MGEEIQNNRIQQFTLPHKYHKLYIKFLYQNHLVKIVYL